MEAMSFSRKSRLNRYHVLSGSGGEIILWRWQTAKKISLKRTRGEENLFPRKGTIDGRPHSVRRTVKCYSKNQAAGEAQQRKKDRSGKAKSDDLLSNSLFFPLMNTAAMVLSLTGIFPESICIDSEQGDASNYAENRLNIKE